MGRGLVGCSRMQGGCRGQAERVGGTGGGGHERLALSAVAEKLASPRTLFQQGMKHIVVSLPFWEVVWGGWRRSL